MLGVLLSNVMPLMQGVMNTGRSRQGPALSTQLPHAGAPVSTPVGRGDGFIAKSTYSKADLQASTWQLHMFPISGFQLRML